MLDYLKSTLTTIEGLYPGCGILLTGDFNRLNISRLLLQFKLKQLVRVPTRGDSTLDLIITNMPQLYNKNQVLTFPPFGLSDHNVVLLPPTSRPSRGTSSRRTMTRRDTRLSQKHSYYLCFRYCFCFFACRYLIVSFHYLKFVRGIVNYL